MNNVKLTKYQRKPSYVDAVQVTAENMNELAKWCNGKIRVTRPRDDGRQPANYIHVPVEKSRNKRETMAFEGDWTLVPEPGCKVCTERAFEYQFDEVVGPEAVADLLKETVSA